MTNVHQMQLERIKNEEDFFNNIIPKRMPVNIRMYHGLINEYSGENFCETQYDFEKLRKGGKKICDSIYSDICPVPGGNTRLASFYQLLGAKCFKMGTLGHMQHPEVSGMNQDEYDELINDPYAFMLETVLPRIYDNLNSTKNPVMSMLSFSIANESKKEDETKIRNLVGDLVDEYGYYPGAPRGSIAATAAPFDYLADFLRSFTGISVDIKRNRNKVLEACDALYPLLFKWGLPPNPHPQGGVFTPLHMAPYLREKDFAEIWWPTYKRLVEDYTALGVRTTAFCEQNWMRYLDYLQELPANTILQFEYGFEDAKKIKDKLGGKFIIAGLYPSILLNTGSKQQVIDKAKELLDIMLPGGGYRFDFDKGLFSTLNIENLNALSKFLRDYAVYPNAGDNFGKKLNSEGYKCEPLISGKVHSKYNFDWENFKRENPYTPEFAKERFQRYHDQMFNYVLNLML